jgi:hypothetical protein
MKKLRAKKIVFSRQPKPIKLDPAVVDALMYAVNTMADVLNGRLNVAALIPDQMKAQAYEMGFPGFMIKLPLPKPLFRETGEAVIMRGRGFGKRAEMLRALGEESVGPLHEFPRRVHFINIPPELMQPKETPEEAEARTEYLKANPPAWFAKMDKLIADKCIASLEKKIADEKAQKDQAATE